MSSKKWNRAKAHLVFHRNSITQCGRKTVDVLKSTATKRDVTCGNCLRWMNGETGRKLGWATLRRPKSRSAR